MGVGFGGNQRFKSVTSTLFNWFLEDCPYPFFYLQNINVYDIQQLDNKCVDLISKLMHFEKKIVIFKDRCNTPLFLISNYAFQKRCIFFQLILLKPRNYFFWKWSSEFSSNFSSKKLKFETDPQTLFGNGVKKYLETSQH